MLKNLSAMRETSVRSMVWEDPLKKGVAARSSIPAWRIPRQRSQLGDNSYSQKEWTGLSD